MAKKCPKNFTKLFHQRTLAETWFPQKNSKTKQYKKNKSDGSTSDDSDFVPSSQDVAESKLRKKVNQTLPRRSSRQSKSPKNVNQSSIHKLKSHATPQKTSAMLLQRKLTTPDSTPNKNKLDIISSSESNKQLSIGDVCEVNSFVIKEEIDEMLQNVNEFDSIEMMHDLSGLIAGDEILPNQLKCSPQIITCTVNTESTDESDKQEEKDPLQFDKNEESESNEQQEYQLYMNKTQKKNVLIKNENRKRRKIIDIEKRRKKQVTSSSSDSEDDELSDEALRLLGELHIKLQHKVPPQHTIENCAGSRALTENQVQLFESYGPLKRGPFTKTEDEIIKKNWTNFCELHDWNEKWVEPFLNMRHEGKYYIPNLEERKNFVRFLSNGLPWRSLYSVYFRFRNLYSPVNNSFRHYTEKEDKKIIKYVTQTRSSGVNGNRKCAELAKILNRTRQSVFRRYTILKLKYDLKSTKFEDSYESDFESEEEKDVTKKKRKRTPVKKKKKKSNNVYKKVYKQVKWSYPLVSRFIEKLMEVMSCTDVEELKNQTIDDEIWKKMEKNISIDHSVLQKFWNLQLHMQLFCPKSIYLNDLKMDLIEYLYKNKISSESIEWDKVKLDFKGVTPDFLSKLFDHLVNYVKTKFDNIDIQIAEIIEYLYNTHIRELEEKTTDAILPKLQYRSGRVMCLDKGPEKISSKGTTTNPLSDKEYEN